MAGTTMTTKCNSRSSTATQKRFPMQCNKAGKAGTRIWHNRDGLERARQKESRMITKKRSIALLFTLICLGSTLPPAAIAQQSKNVSPVAPRRELVETVVKEAYEKFKGDTNGKNADYIPYLAKVDSKLFGIAIVTTDNQVLTIG